MDKRRGWSEKCKKKKKTKNLYLGFTYFKQGRICITGQHKKKGTLEDFFWNSRDRRLQEIKFPSPPEHGPQCRSRDLGMWQTRNPSMYASKLLVPKRGWKKFDPKGFLVSIQLVFGNEEKANQGFIGWVTARLWVVTGKTDTQGDFLYVVM